MVKEHGDNPSRMPGRSLALMLDQAALRRGSVRTIPLPDKRPKVMQGRFSVLSARLACRRQGPSRSRQQVRPERAASTTRRLASSIPESASGFSVGEATQEFPYRLLLPEEEARQKFPFQIARASSNF
ncbi:hypothetical protein [Mesorhizobium sophorae]|uniref:hypothetical protein n=1 Tax=Mesorhizobium sophorae TaxID=1300294 RepID=UPI00197EB184|nr:hypothetical protein [Mesorhizobium sophorae]